MGGLATNDIAAFVTLALLLALVLVLLLRWTRNGRDISCWGSMIVI